MRAEDKNEVLDMISKFRLSLGQPQSAVLLGNSLRSIEAFEDKHITSPNSLDVILDYSKGDDMLHKSLDFVRGCGIDIKKIKMENSSGSLYSVKISVNTLMKLLRDKTVFNVTFDGTNLIFNNLESEFTKL